MAVLCLLSNTPWPWPTPAGAASAGCAEISHPEHSGGHAKGTVCTSEYAGRLHGAFYISLSRARDGVPQKVWLPYCAACAELLLGTPHALRKQSWSWKWRSYAKHGKR